MSKVEVIDIEQLLIAKILTEVFELHRCNPECIKRMVNKLVSLKTFHIDDFFVKVVCSICPITFRGLISFTNIRAIPIIINDLQYEKFTEIIDCIESDRYSVEVMSRHIPKNIIDQIAMIFVIENALIKRIIGEPTLENVKKRHFPSIHENTCMISIGDKIPYQENLQIQEYDRQYPIPLTISVNEGNVKITASIKEFCKMIIFGEITGSFTKFLAIEIAVLKEYYRK